MYRLRSTGCVQAYLTEAIEAGAFALAEETCEDSEGLFHAGAVPPKGV